MSETTHKLPFYLKFTVILVGGCLLVYILSMLQGILVPFAIAALFAVLLNPLYKKLDMYMPRLLAALVTVIIGIIVVGGIAYLLSTQVNLLVDNFPLIKEKINFIVSQGQDRLLAHYHIGFKEQTAFIQKMVDNTQVVSQTIVSLYGLLSFMILLPFYVLLFLYYKPLILEFIFNIFSKKDSEQVGEILEETRGSVQSYIMGLLIETSIVAALNTIALLILGVKYALLIGVIGGLLNMIPYIGGIVAIIIPMLVALLTKDTISIQISIVISYLVIQFIDNHILVPRVVSSKVKINALFSILFVLLGATLRGIPGMFLAIPFVGVLKIILDKSPAGKPRGKLLGVEMPPANRGLKWYQRFTQRRK